MPRDVLLFDLDGTLVDSAPAIARALSLLRAERGAAPIATDAVRPWISLGVDVLVHNALGEVAAGAGDVAAFRAILRALPVDRDCVYMGVADALTMLAADNFTMAILTNKPEALSRLLLGELGLADRFAAIVGGDTTPHAKPHRAPPEHALRLLGASADRAMLIGDSDVDAATARVLGVPFLLFTGGYGAEAVGEGDIAARFGIFATLPGLVGALAGG